MQEPNPNPDVLEAYLEQNRDRMELTLSEIKRAVHEEGNAIIKELSVSPGKTLSEPDPNVIENRMVNYKMILEWSRLYFREILRQRLEWEVPHVWCGRRGEIWLHFCRGPKTLILIIERGKPVYYHYSYGAEREEETKDGHIRTVLQFIHVWTLYLSDKRRRRRNRNS